MRSFVPSSLLVIALEGLWKRVVEHKPHIGLVDAHPECNRRHDDLTM